MKIINWELVRPPINWVTVFIMVIIPLAGFEIVSRYHSANYRPPTA